MVWPLPALLTWLAAWALLLGLRSAGLPPAIAFVLVTLATAWPAWRLSHRWRRLIVLAGFPCPSWPWCKAACRPGPGWPRWPCCCCSTRCAAGATRRCFPPRPRPWTAWPPPRRCPPAPGCWKPAAAWATACALHRAYPDARLTGLEWSAPLATLCRLRCRFAQVRRGDIWTEDWSGYQMVYLFQRPESMPRAVAKARRELKPGAWLVSLEFEATELSPVAQLETVAGKPVWLYQAPWV
jgi:hypothetical protein